MNARMQLLKIDEVLSIKCGKRVDPKMPVAVFHRDRFRIDGQAGDFSGGPDLHQVCRGSDQAEHLGISRRWITRWIRARTSIFRRSRWRRPEAGERILRSASERSGGLRSCSLFHPSPTSAAQCNSPIFIRVIRSSRRPFATWKCWSWSGAAVDLLIGSVHPPHHQPATRALQPVSGADLLRAARRILLQIRERSAKADGRWPKALDRAARARYGPRLLRRRCERGTPLYFADLFCAHGDRRISTSTSPIAPRIPRFSSRRFRGFRSASPPTARISCPIWGRMICFGKSAPRRNLSPPKRITAASCCGSAARKRRTKFIAFTTASTWRICPRPAQGERPPGPTTILSVGRLVPFKGFEILLEACAELRPAQFRFSLPDRGRRPAAREARGA